MNKSLLEKREGSFAYVVVTESIGSLSFNHFPFFGGDHSSVVSGERTKGWPPFALAIRHAKTMCDRENTQFRANVQRDANNAQRKLRDQERRGEHNCDV